MRTLVLHPEISDGKPARRPEDALTEARGLAEALDLDVVDARVVPLATTRAGTLFGTGKIAELAEAIAAGEIGLVIVDGPLTPVQQRNLERAWKVKILDRTGLILEIFGERARTREGVLQVELAHLTYQRTRLVRSWTHLERQRGGLGFVGGPGETQIEADRRALDDRIQRIRQSLAKVVRTRALHRTARRRVAHPVVALVGYTNAGKSTLFNRLTGAAVVARDMPFATLDPTMRGVDLPSGRRVVLSDTVGFISDLPTQLVAAFRATLEEVLDADLILHVRDMAHPEADAQAADVRAILADLGIDAVAQARMIEVWNKLDLLPPDRRQALQAAVARAERVQLISARTGEGTDALLAAIEAEFAEPVSEETLALGFEEGRERAWLHAHHLVAREVPNEAGYLVAVRWTERDRREFNALKAGG